eukprot:2564887-Prymnesium_polylepis.1
MAQDGSRWITSSTRPLEEAGVRCADAAGGGVAREQCHGARWAAHGRKIVGPPWLHLALLPRVLLVGA